MRYLPLTDRRPPGDAGRDRRGLDRRSLRGCAARRRGSTASLDLPRAQGELEVERALARLAAKNCRAGSVPFFIGGGVYRHHVPAAVDHLIQRGEFLTSYTPYQPEMAQGTLQMLFEFQTQVALLTGMEVANASMYDGATACAEAVMMANRVTAPEEGDPVGRSASALPRGRRGPMRASSASRRSSRSPIPRRARISPPLIDGDTSCVVVQNPDFFGAGARLLGARRGLPRGGRAAGRRRHRDRLARRRQVAGRDGRRHRRRRGPVARQRAQFRRAACRASSPRASSIVRQMPGPARRRDRRRRRPARLGADPLDPRAAHPPREGDEQHLHQFRAVRARLHDPSGAARRGRA